MSQEIIAIHYVCTREQGEELVAKKDKFFVSNCGCRESRGSKCNRSRMDVCLYFRDDFGPTGAGFRQISKKEVEEIFQEAKNKHLVTRPFRSDKDFSETAGICFCCDDCCGYFLNPQEKCDKGKLIEKTDREVCNNCGICVEVCYFKARKINGQEFVIERENCYGCGLCLDVCALECIEMEKR